MIDINSPAALDALHQQIGSAMTGVTPVIPPAVQAGAAAAGTTAVVNQVGGTGTPQQNPNADQNTNTAGETPGMTTDPNFPGGNTVTNAATATGINATLNELLGTNVDWSSVASKFGPAAIGAIIGATQNKPAPIQQTPWNASYFAPLQNATLETMANNKLQLPTVPGMQQIPDLANDTAANAYADSVVKHMQQSFSDIGGPLSAIRSDFTADQPGGGTRQQLAEGVAAGREGLAENLARANIMNAIYPTNLNYNAQRVQQNNANTQWGFGQNTGRETALWQAPWQNLTQAGNIFTGAAGKGQTTVLPSTPWWQTAAGGALAAQNIWNKANG
jgi:hypothetical protein